MKIKFKNVVLLLILSLFLLMTSLTSCKEKDDNKSTETTIEEKYPDVNKPKIPEGITDEEVSYAYSLIIVDLMSYGYDVFNVIADNGVNKEFGIGYTDYADGYELGNGEKVIGAGFLGFNANQRSSFADLKVKTYLYPLDADLNIAEDDFKFVASFDEDGVPKGHFILNDKYIKYEFEYGLVKLESLENDVNNYDLSLGRMYNYDTDEYEFIPYNEISSQPLEYTPLVDGISNEELKNNLNEIMHEQESKGYALKDITISFISLDALNALSGFLSQEETLNGYTFEELDKLDFDNEKEYIFFNEDGSISIKNLPLLPKDDYKKILDWIADYLILAGTSTVALICMVAGGPAGSIVSGGLIGAGIQYFNETIIEGKRIDDANWAKIGLMGISGALGAAVPCISQPILGYLAAGAVGGLTSASVTALDGGTPEEIFASGAQGAVTSIIMHGLFSSCFKAGTKVLTENGKESIENIKVGTKVASYNIYTGKVEYQSVLNTYINKGEEFVTIKLEDGEEITSTNNHPYYVPEEKTYIPAKDLKEGMYVLDSNNNKIKIIDINYEISSEAVYNINVDNNHNYFVGDDEILVHNLCESYARRKAVKLAWKEVQNDPSLLGKELKSWELDELLAKGKIKGFEGHHIIPVNELRKMGRNDLISDPDNIVFLRVFDHKFVHQNGAYSFLDTKTNLSMVLSKKRPNLDLNQIVTNLLNKVK